jgi:hypothetical protein
VRGPYLQRAESLDGPGVKFMKTVKKREPGEKVAADASAPVREGL